MNFGKKLTIIGLIIFGLGVPSTAITMSSPLFDLPPGMQGSTTIDPFVIHPDTLKNIKYTFQGYNPVIVNFNVNPEGTPYNVVVTSYEYSYEALNVVESGSATHKIDNVRVGTYDFDFTNLGDEEIYLSIEINDANYDDIMSFQKLFSPIMISIYYVVFFGGIATSIFGAIAWKTRK